MARRAPPLKVAITEGAIRVTSRERSLTLRPSASPPDAEDAPDYIIELDEIAFWDPPHAADEIAIEDLQRILDAIEEECDEHGLSVAFE